MNPKDPLSKDIRDAMSGKGPLAGKQENGNKLSSSKLQQKGMDALPDVLRIKELGEIVTKLSKLLGKQYAMDWDELEAMLDRVANEGWDTQRAKDWVKLWQNPREIENPYEAEIAALRAENQNMREALVAADKFAELFDMELSSTEKGTATWVACSKFFEKMKLVGDVRK